MARRRPLHTCASSCIGIAHKASAKIQDLDGPLGSTAKRAVTVFNSFFPFLYTMLRQWLALVSILDDHILTIENKIETILPQTTCLFDKIDALVCAAETLPERAEDIVRKFASMAHQFPLLDWILVHLISWLNFLLSILTHWGSKNTREKEITIDINCNDVHSCKTVSEEKVNRKEPSKSVQFEKGNAESLNENGNEHSKGVPSEVIHLSVKRLHSWKSRIKALEEPLYAGDSPMYSSYQSANSSPVSDGENNQMGKGETMSCSYKEMLVSDENSHAGKGDGMSCSYKEMLERGTKEDDNAVHVETN